VFEEVMELLAPMARTKVQEFLFDFPSSLPARYFGDAGRLRQVLLNLVGNALKFTEKGFVEVRVKGEAGDGFGELVVEVADSGIGMTAEQAGRLFQPFEQAEPGTQRRFGGTGLGLALSKKIAGGRVGVCVYSAAGDRRGNAGVCTAAHGFAGSLRPRSGASAGGRAALVSGARGSPG
jgi:signal transduction histidine kinase